MKNDQAGDLYRSKNPNYDSLRKLVNSRKKDSDNTVHKNPFFETDESQMRSSEFTSKTKKRNKTTRSKSFESPPKGNIFYNKGSDSSLRRGIQRSSTNVDQSKRFVEQPNKVSEGVKSDEKQKIGSDYVVNNIININNYNIKNFYNPENSKMQTANGIILQLEKLRLD